jgi:hypothetical protein
VKKKPDRSQSTSTPKQEKVVSVREHPRHVAISTKNPQGITLVDEHLRRLHGTYLDAPEIEKVFKNYNRKGLTFPTPNDLGFKKIGNLYDETIAVWTEYFNKKFKANPPLDPDIIKALIGSESSFIADPPGNEIAIGITQITKSTLKISQDPQGEVKEFIFQGINQKDLKNPNIAIPITTRWIFRKKELARSKLKREPTHEEIILEYKGLLKSKSKYKNKALKNYRGKYARLKKK